jgi:beta-lactamase class A
MIIYKFLKTPYLAIPALLVGILLGRFISLPQSSSKVIKSSYPFRENTEDYKFISPLLFYKGPKNNDLYKPLVSKIQESISTYASGPNSIVSVYYRDLNTGRSIGINENEKYIPASLLKVVVMIAYLKQAELEPSTLSQKITYTKDIQSMIGSIPYDKGSDLKLGESYTIDGLITSMITKSDNGAVYSLLSRLDEKILNHVFKDLNLQNPQTNDRSYTISAEDYASFFRILYNATYLNRAMSEKALNLLSQTDFKDGIVAGADQSIAISHKYGEAVNTGEKNNISSIELHDCGIVYHTKNPYLLCIMTRTDSISKNMKVIQEISRDIYNNVEASSSNI